MDTVNSHSFTTRYVSPGVVNLISATGETTEIHFTDSGQIESIKDPLNRITQFTYDANNYLSQLTAPGNTTYQLLKDATRPKKKRRNSLVSGEFNYDAQGRLLSQTDPLGRSVSFSYGTNSELIESVTDQKGIATQYEYDANRNLTAIRYVDGSSETFSYDSSGRVIEATERSGDRFQYTYDIAGQLTRKTFDDGTFEAYTYDSRGNLTSSSNIHGTTSVTCSIKWLFTPFYASQTQIP
jgi:YD repeat-containing protein